MQTKQMAASLQLIATLTDAKDAELILRFADALAGEPNQKYGQLATKLEKGLKAKGNVPIPNAASQMVQRIADVAGAAGSVPLSKEFAATALVLETLGSVEPSRIATAIADALVPAPKKKTGASKKIGIKDADVDPREMADQLTEAINDNAKFDSLVATLSKLPKGTLEAIAQHFLGTTRKFTGKAAIEAIEARQRQDALDASRNRSISKIAV